MTFQFSAKDDMVNQLIGAFVEVNLAHTSLMLYVESFIFLRTSKFTV